MLSGERGLTLVLSVGQVIPTLWETIPNISQRRRAGYISFCGQHLSEKSSLTLEQCNASAAPGERYWAWTSVVSRAALTYTERV